MNQRTPIGDPRKRGIARDVAVNKRTFLTRINLSVLFLCTLLLGACTGGGDDQFQAEEAPAAPYSGMAVDGLVVGAEVNLYVIDFTSQDLKGELISSGSTDSSGSITGVALTEPYFLSGPFLLEVTGGSELNNSIPVFSTLRTTATADQIRGINSYHATVLTTFVLELARLDIQTNSDTDFSDVLAEQQEIVKQRFGLGLLDSLDLFTAPIIFEEDFGQEDAPLSAGNRATNALNMRTANAVLVALVDQLLEQDPNVTANQILDGLAADQLDGAADGMADGVSVEALSGIDPQLLYTVLSMSPAQLQALVIPGTNRTIAEMNELLVEETAVLDSSLEVGLLPLPAIKQVVPGVDRDGDGIIDGQDLYPDDPLNIAMVARAGADREVAVGVVTILDGSDSTGVSGGGALSYLWEFVSFTAEGADQASDKNVIVELGDDSSKAFFTPDEVGDYQFQLTITAGGSTGVDSVRLSATQGNLAPTADAGDDRVEDVYALVTLDASDSLDPNGDALTYTWEFVSFIASGDSEASSKSLDLVPASAGSAQATFTPDQAGLYEFRVTADDGSLTATDTVLITAEQLVYQVTGTGSTIDDTFGAPLATQAVIGTATVTLDGSGAFSSISMNLTVETTSAAGSATVTSYSVFDEAGAGTVEVLTCTGISQVCDNAGVGGITASNPLGFDYSDVSSITWSTAIQKPSPINPGGTATVTLNLTAAPD